MSERTDDQMMAILIIRNTIAKAYPNISKQSLKQSNEEAIGLCILLISFVQLLVLLDLTVEGKKRGKGTTRSGARETRRRLRKSE
ncbi:hypothetical protein B9C88_01935 [Brevibacillus laterosporus]|uniref:hypothetical protein n=1 Tax=Brevibacillus laterosporus TaxID=1465 RepID=UPI000BCDF3E3|nr:hypothetical protein [Brevibacillus laterosporus]PCN46292.1 hypothetical protein B9C88_01935 [Brevibacillus laterosporus]